MKKTYVVPLLKCKSMHTEGTALKKQATFPCVGLANCTLLTIDFLYTIKKILHIYIGYIHWFFLQQPVTIWLSLVLQDALRHLYQRCIVESEPDILESIYQVILSSPHQYHRILASIFTLVDIKQG